MEKKPFRIWTVSSKQTGKVLLSKGWFPVHASKNQDSNRPTKRRFHKTGTKRNATFVFFGEENTSRHCEASTLQAFFCFHPICRRGAIFFYSKETVQWGCLLCATIPAEWRRVPWIWVVEKGDGTFWGIWNPTQEVKRGEVTPRKINAWNLRVFGPPIKGKSSSKLPNHHFQVLC